MGNWLDLHMHSCVSGDGEFEPERLMALCREHGLRTVALADHNSVGGVGAAKAAAERLGMEFFQAAEFDVTLSGTNYHLLGYGIDRTAPVWKAVEEQIRTQERGASETRMDLVLSTGLKFNKEEVRSRAFHGIVIGESVGEACLKNPENDENELLLPYRDGGVRSENPYVNFYWDFCAQGKPAYVPVHFPDFSDMAAFIHSQGGAAVLAHPGANAGKDERLLDLCVEAGIDGMEVYSSYHDADSVRFFEDYARRRGVFATVGSDFHGRLKPAIRFGEMDCGCQEEILGNLKDAICGRS